MVDRCKNGLEVQRVIIPLVSTCSTSNSGSGLVQAAVNPAAKFLKTRELRQKWCKELERLRRSKFGKRVGKEATHVEKRMMLVAEYSRGIVSRSLKCAWSRPFGYQIGTDVRS